MRGDPSGRLLDEIVAEAGQYVGPGERGQPVGVVAVDGECASGPVELLVAGPARAEVAAEELGGAGLDLHRVDEGAERVGEGDPERVERAVPSPHPRQLQLGRDLGDQLARGERFDDVVVRTGKQALNPGLLPGLGGDEHDGNCHEGLVGAQGRVQVEPVDTGQPHVAEHEVGRRASSSASWPSRASWTVHSPAPPWTTPKSRSSST